MTMVKPITTWKNERKWLNNINETMWRKAIFNDDNENDMKNYEREVIIMDININGWPDNDEN